MISTYIWRYKHKEYWTLCDWGTSSIYYVAYKEYIFKKNTIFTPVFPFHNTVVPVFSGLCDQGTPAVSGQYNDVRGDFQYKLTRDQGTPANADADRHLFVIFAPQPGDSALFILFFITLGRKRYQISLLMRILSLKRMSNRLPQLRTQNNNDASRRCASWEK